MDGQRATVKSDEAPSRGQLIKIHLLLDHLNVPEGYQTSKYQWLWSKFTAVICTF